MLNRYNLNDVKIGDLVTFNAAYIGDEGHAPAKTRVAVASGTKTHVTVCVGGRMRTFRRNGGLELGSKCKSYVAPHLTRE